MSTHPDSDSIPASDITSKIQQSLGQNRGQVVGDMSGGVIIGNLFVYQSSQPTTTDSVPVKSDDTAKLPLALNPYKGLLAFQETDGDNFFGREKQIAALWEKFIDLYESESKTRLLPIYGPSGSGKSSLARAGLVPELGRRFLPGYDRARVAVLMPGSHPLEALAKNLARIATNDKTPVSKTREFAEELGRITKTGHYDGLRRIASLLPQIDTDPLIILIDQFEELYAPGVNKPEKDAFVGNLLHAASDPSKQVMIIITFRSDFLGETHRHSELNQLFSSQGYLVPAMNEQEIRDAIRKPAEQANRPLDDATIELLAKDAEGREGVLPLLQFTLSHIWEKFPESPVEIFKRIGGVGGALAEEAERIYKTLTVDDQKIARRVFLGLIQLNENTKNTRRRVSIAQFVSHTKEPEQVRQVINKFAESKVRLITLSAEKSPSASATESLVETAEVTHETLFEHWGRLKLWIDDNRDDIRFQRRFESAVQQWKGNGRQKQDLWRNLDLQILEQYHSRLHEEMTPLQIDFFHNSLKDRRNSMIRRNLITIAIILGPIGFCLAGFAHKGRIHLAWIILNKKSLSGVNLENSYLAYPEASLLSNSNFDKANFSKADLTGIHLSGSNLKQSQFKSTYMPGSKFINVNLEDAILSKADLTESNLSGSILRGSKFIDTYMPRSSLQSSDLLKSNFTKANLDEADLSKANLEDVIFVRTYMPKANLKGSDISGADFRDNGTITPEQVKAALNWEKAIYDNDFCKLLKLKPCRTK